MARGSLARKSIPKDKLKSAHKPILSESLTTIRHGNVPGVSATETEYWLDLISETQQVLLEIAIGHAPQALFPIEVHRKFGFNIPVGALFDHSNFIPLQEALGQDLIANYQKHYKEKDPPKSTIEWALGRPDLTDQEILDSWNEDSEPDDANEPFELRVFHRNTQIKAKMRAVGFVFACGGIEHDFHQVSNSVGTVTIKK